MSLVIVQHSHGDTIHMVNNAFKKFFSKIDSFFDVQTLTSDVFYDIEYSPKVRSLFGHVQAILFGDKTANPSSDQYPTGFYK